MILHGFTFAGREHDPLVNLAVQLINIDSMCQRYSCLPRPGGLLSQDARLVRGLGFVIDAYGRKEAMELEKAKKNAKQ